MSKRYRSDAMGGIHETMEALYDAGAIDQQTIRHFDDTCLTPIRPLRPGCGTVLKAQLLTLPEIIRIIAPGEVTIQLSSRPPASSSATEVLGSSDSRLATAQPPEPPPTTTKSNESATATPQLLMRQG